MSFVCGLVKHNMDRNEVTHLLSQPDTVLAAELSKFEVDNKLRAAREVLNTLSECMYCQSQVRYDMTGHFFMCPALPGTPSRIPKAGGKKLAQRLAQTLATRRQRHGGI